MKIYVAAKYGRREELKAVHQKLREAGHEPTSTWIEKGEDDTEAAWVNAAQLDVADVMRANAIIFFGQPKGSENRGGGRWFELGLAWSIGLRTIVILDKGHESVFTLLPEMEAFYNIEDAIAALGK